MNIEKDMLSVNPFSRPGKKMLAIKALVVHWVANPKSTARQNRDYFEGLRKQSLDNPQSRYASAHFIVGLDGEIIQCIPWDEMAYHVGAKTYTPLALSKLGHYPNNCTIGVELCHPGWDGAFTGETWKAAAELCNVLCEQNSLDPEEDILRHFDVTGKLCPKYFVDNPEEFARFKGEVAA
ncbi:MAG: N-acetylmuramoyl-L-alanine amidase [Treponematales bacterium]